MDFREGDTQLLGNHFLTTDSREQTTVTLTTEEGMENVPAYVWAGELGGTLGQCHFVIPPHLYLNIYTSTAKGLTVSLGFIVSSVSLIASDRVKVGDEIVQVSGWCVSYHVRVVC